MRNAEALEGRKSLGRVFPKRGNDRKKKRAKKTSTFKMVTRDASWKTRAKMNRSEIERGEKGE